MTDPLRPAAQAAVVQPVHVAGTQPGRSGGVAGGFMAVLRRRSAWFWRSFMFWWTERAPIVVLITKPFFMRFAWRYSNLLRHGTCANARRILLDRDPARGEPEPARVEALARSMVDQFYVSVYELGRGLRLSPEELRAQIQAVEGRDCYLSARAAGRGAIVVTAHLGSFELGAAALAEQERAIHVVYHRDDHPRFDRLRSDLRRALGLREAPVDDGLSVWLRLREALMRDEVVLLQADRVMPGQKGVKVPFMGGHIMMPAGPVKLALLTGAPIVPIFSIREAPGKVRVMIQPPVLVSAEDGPVNGAHPAMRAVAEAVAGFVRSHPEQWVMVYPAWCEDAADHA